MVKIEFIGKKVCNAMNEATSLGDKESGKKLHEFYCEIYDSLDFTRGKTLSYEEIKNKYNELKEDLFIYL